MTEEKKCIKFVKLTLQPGDYLYIEGEEKPKVDLPEEVVAFYILEGELYAQAQNSFRTGRFGPKEFVGTEGFVRRIGAKDGQKFPYKNTVFTNPDKQQKTVLVGFTHKGMIELFRTQPVAAFQMVAGWVRRALEVEEEFIDYVSNTYKTPIVDELETDVKRLSDHNPEELARIIVSLQKNLREANSLFLSMQQQERNMNRQIDDLSKNLRELSAAFKQLSMSFLEQTLPEQPYPIRVDLRVDDDKVDEIFEGIKTKE